MKPRRANIYRTKSWFKVLQTTRHSQTAVMTLGAGQSSGEEPEAHAGSEQTLLLLEGELHALIAGKRSRMKTGDVVVIPPKTKHKFTNPGRNPAVTFSVYCPPEYPSGEEG
jgi:mannose-6-phosphate isomerase-like protein (cupin superfamily)